MFRDSSRKKMSARYPYTMFMYVKRLTKPDLSDLNAIVIKAILSESKAAEPKAIPS